MSVRDMFNNEEALKLWLSEMGDKEYAYDFAGRKIKRDDYLVENQVGWIITFLKPLELGGANNIGNTIIMHHRTFEEKGLDYPKFMAHNNEFLVQYDKKGDFYYVEKILDDDEDDDGFFI